MFQDSKPLADAPDVRALSLPPYGQRDLAGLRMFAVFNPRGAGFIFRFVWSVYGWRSPSGYFGLELSLLLPARMTFSPLRGSISVRLLVRRIL
jgi:hypothetical protein